MNIKLRRFFEVGLLSLVTACSQSIKADAAKEIGACAVQFMILGTSQDAGTPQIGHVDDPAWADINSKRLATSAALIDSRDGQRYLFEATPDIREQLKNLDKAFPSSSGHNLGLSNIFITHAHIGHYAGLMFLGRESAGTRDVGVSVMPRLKTFLENNGPWNQLIKLNNIRLDSSLKDGEALNIAQDLSVTPLLVPHRDEYSETVGYIISGPSHKILFLPDIDDWDRWAVEFNRDIVEIIGSVDNAFIDATFFDNNELPGRDMTKIPHPRVTDTMDRLKGLADKVHFIHINHTNPLRNFKSEEMKHVRSHGFHVAKRGQIFCL